MTTSTSPRLLCAPRTEQQALRAIYDRRAAAIRWVSGALADAAAYRRYLMAPASAWVAAHTIEQARMCVQVARNARLSSTMGARLP